MARYMQENCKIIEHQMEVRQKEKDEKEKLDNLIAKKAI
jgi:hypothetical protein